MTTETELAQAVKVAKEAVGDLEEPLKTEAFKIILEKLISKGKKVTRPTRGPGQGKRSSRTKSQKRASSGRSPQTKVPTQSSLDFDVDQLRSLKIYCQRFDLGGTEQTAFIISNFLRENTDLQNYSAADVEYCYRQLVAQKVKKLPVVNDTADWARALSWLAVPSRKKQWLQKRGEGFVVSNAGLLRFNDLEVTGQTAVKDE